QIAGRGIQASTGPFRKTGHLRGGNLQQIGEIIVAVNAINVTPVARSRQQLAVRVEYQRIDDIVSRTPDPGWRAIGSNSVHVRSAARSSARKWKRPSLNGRGGRVGCAGRRRASSGIRANRDRG